MDVPGDVNSGTNALNLRMDIPSGDQADFGALGAGHPFILVISAPAVVDVAPSFTDQHGRRPGLDSEHRDNEHHRPGGRWYTHADLRRAGQSTGRDSLQHDHKGYQWNAYGSRFGTITIRASNSEGDADWTVDYATTAALAAPSFADDTGDDQSWTVNAAITDITVPAADGNPTPTYAVQGSLPAGIAFNTTTRIISGTPTGAGSGTITIQGVQLGR